MGPQGDVGPLGWKVGARTRHQELRSRGTVSNCSQNASEVLFFSRYSLPHLLDQESSFVVGQSPSGGPKIPFENWIFHNREIKAPLCQLQTISANAGETVLANHAGIDSTGSRHSPHKLS